MMDHSSDFEESNIHVNEIYIKEEPVFVAADDFDHQVERISIKTEPELFPDNLPSTCSNFAERNIRVRDDCNIYIKEDPELLIADDLGDNVGSVWMVCYHCGHKSVSLGRLRKHIVWRHIRAIPPQLDTRSILEDNNATSVMRNVQKPFQCSYCSYSCRMSCNLKTHIMIHTEEKPFQCKLCCYSCRESGSLKKHIFIHTGEKPFQCKLCSYSCRDSTNLKRHILRHAKEKPFQCKLCSYSCRRSDVLKKHIFIHTGEKPFQCKLCSYSCSQSGNLMRHILTHLKEKPFQCMFCSYSCSRTDALKGHMLTHREK